MTTIQVSTIRHTVIAAGLIEIFASTRETKGKKIAAENRTRAILIPELIVTGLPEKFTIFLRDQLYAIAKQQLGELWEASTDGLQFVDASIWDVDSLLSYAATRSESQKLSGELVKTHFAEFLDTMPKDKRDAIRDVLVSFAGPKRDCNLKRCEFLTDQINRFILATEEDGEEVTWVIRSVLKKIEAHHTELSAMLSATDAF